MTNVAIQPEQHFAAKVVGSLYLLTMATGVFGEIYVRGQLVVRNDAMQTATNIVANERLFRLGIVSDLLTLVGVAILVWALYVVLRPIHRNLASLAAFLRLIALAIGAAGIANAFIALRLLGRATYLQSFDAPQLQALSRVFISAQGFGTQIDYVFFGLGSTVFSYLWLKSRYIPRVLAALGLFGSLLLTIGGLLIMVFPSLADALSLTYMMPLGIFEITLGLWLLLKGLQSPGAGSPGSSDA